MSASLTDLLLRVRAALRDTPGLAYDTATLDEAIRQALAVYMLSAGSLSVTLAGLDGATETTLPALHESLVVCGAAAYATQARAAEQAGRAADDIPSIPALNAWADERLKEFHQLLALVFPQCGQSAETAAREALAAIKAEAEAARLAQLRVSLDVPWRAWIGPDDVDDIGG